jgi:uncharacterized Zn-finger protein
MCNITLPSISNLPLPNFSALHLPPLRIVTEEVSKKHYCEYCLKTFNTKASLKRHLKTHSKIRPYSCKACNKSFSRNDILSRHKESTKCIRNSLALSNSTLFGNSGSTIRPHYPLSPNPLMSITSILSDCSSYFESECNLSSQSESYTSD